jgi:hypothetical protein
MRRLLVSNGHLLETIERPIPTGARPIAMIGDQYACYCAGDTFDRQRATDDLPLNSS